MRDILKVAIVVVWFTHSGETASLVLEADGVSALGLKPQTANVVTAYARLTCISQTIQQQYAHAHFTLRINVLYSKIKFHCFLPC